MVYHHAGWWDCTLLPYVICSLQGYPGDVGKKFRDRHLLRWHTCCIGWTLKQCQGSRCPEPGVLSAMNGWEGDCVRVRGAPVGGHLQILMASFLECFPPDHIPELKQDHFYRGPSKWLKVMVAYPKASGNEKVYSDYIQVVEKQRKKKWNHPITCPWPVPTSPGQPASFLYRGSKAANQPWPLLHRWCI